MEIDLLKETETTLRGGEDTRDCEVLFILEPTLVLNDNYYERVMMEEYTNHESVYFTARSSSEITSIATVDRRTNYAVPWAPNLGNEFVNLIQMQREIKAMTPEGHYSMWRYIAGKSDIHTVMGIKVYMDYYQEYGATRNWL